MSLDIVDDLEAAEDHIGVLTVELRSLATLRHNADPLAHGQGGFNQCPEGLCVVYRALCEPWQRPTGDDDEG